MMPCKQCKKEVEGAALTCPHCGVSNPGISTKHALFGVAALAAIVVAVVVACSDSSTPKITEGATPASATAASSTAPAEEARPNFGFDSQEFRTRFNALAKEVGKEWQIQQPLTINPGSKKDTWTHTAAQTPMVGTVDKQSSNLESILISVTGGDDAKSLKAFAVLHIVANALAANAKKDDVSEALMRVVKKALDNPGGDRASENVGGVRISAGAGEGMGLLVTYSPAK